MEISQNPLPTPRRADDELEMTLAKLALSALLLLWLALPLLTEPAEAPSLGSETTSRSAALTLPGSP